MKPAINATFFNGTADWKTFVRKAAAIGYQGVELSGSEKTLGPANECRAFVEDHGIKIAAFIMTVTYNPWPPNTEQYRAGIEYAAKLGVKTLVSTGGFIPNQRRNTYPFDYDMFAGNFGKAMKYADRFGQTIAFHNHRGCVVETIKETKEMIKRLPAMKLCVDIAHCEACGVDAIEYIRTFKNRIIATHIKDYSWKKDSFIELGKGDGRLDVAICIHELAKLGYDGWLIAELDRKVIPGQTPPLPEHSAKQCLNYMKKTIAALHR